MKKLWSDGSAVPNPGRGGFAVIEEIETEAGRIGKPVRLGKEENSTNIRMEGWALISAMEYAAGEAVEIYSDSEFWINVLTKWAPGWQAKGWKKTKGEIKNLDLVKRAYELYSAGRVELKWVRGHVGIELNELADEWANRARTGEELGD